MKTSLLSGQARFRVMGRSRTGEVRLICLAIYRDDAVEAAQAYCQQPAADVVSVVTEKWHGLPTAGKWKLLEPYDGGFRWRRATRGFAVNNLPRSGDFVQAVIQTEKTKKGGFIAKLFDRELKGPVTNSHDCPAFAEGQLVTLRVEAVSKIGDRIQFRWLQV